jgi:hypothetical protein
VNAYKQCDALTNNIAVINSSGSIQHSFLSVCIQSKLTRPLDVRSRLLLVPGLLEYGSPSHDVWPDNPEWEERQITCDFGVRTLHPCLFAELIIRLNGPEGRRQLKIVPDPVPVFLSHHAIFFAGVDQGGCTDCYNVRRRLRARQPRVTSSTSTMADANGSDAIVGLTAADGSEDDALHKVHVMLHNRMDAIRVQVSKFSVVKGREILYEIMLWMYFSAL